MNTLVKLTQPLILLLSYNPLTVSSLLVMQPGYFCRVLSDRVSQISVHLRPSNFPVPLDYAQTILPTTGKHNKLLVMWLLTLVIC